MADYNLNLELKRIFPDMDDEEIEAGIQQVRSENPDVTDDVIRSEAYNERVRQDIRKKYNIGEFSQEKRKELSDAVDSASSPIAAGIAGFGAGLRGGDVGQAFNAAETQFQKGAKNKLAAFDENRKQAMDEFRYDTEMNDVAAKEWERQEMNDPSSSTSKVAQQSLISLGMSPEAAAKISAAQAAQAIPTLNAQIQRNFQERQFEYQKQRDAQQMALQREQQAFQREIAQNERSLKRDEKMREQGKLSDKQLETITAFDDTKGELDALRSMFRDKYVGKVVGRTPTTDAAATDFRATLGRYVANYRKAISGAGVSDSERAELMSNLPSLTDTPEQFKQKLNTLDKTLDRTRNNFLNNASKVGKNTDPFRGNTSTQGEGSIFQPIVTSAKDLF